MKKWVFFFFCLALLFCLSSCATKTMTVTEYVTVPVDIEDITKSVYALKPDNSKLEIVEVNTMADVITNSAAYLKSWILWQTYAEALETVVKHVEEVYGPDQGTSAGSYSAD